MTRGILALALFTMLGAVIAWALITARPDYYQTVAVNNPAVREQARRVEQVLTSQATRVRPDDNNVWQIRVHQQHINHWLAVRMPQWLANQEIDTSFLRVLKNPMVGLVDGRVELAAEAEALGTSSLLRLVYRPRPGNGGPMRLELQGIKSGALPLPTGVLLDQLDEHAETDEARRLLSEARKRLESFELKLPLGDGRTVSIIGMDFDGPAVLLTCRTQRLAARQ